VLASLILLFGLVGLGPATTSTSQAASTGLMTKEVVLHFPAALASFKPINEVIAPSGQLWLASRSRFAAVRLGTGKLALSQQIAGAFTTSPIVGPNDEIWFGEINADGYSSVGEISPTGRTRSFALPSADEAKSVAAGSDGNVWFTAVAGNARPVLGRITPAGQLKLFTTPPQIHGWIGGLIPAAGGGFWATLQLAARVSVAYVSTSGEIRPTAGAVSARALDQAGVLWGWGSNPGRIYRVPTRGSVGQFEWSQSLDLGRPVHGALVRAGDNQLWFAGATVDYDAGSPNGYPIIDPILGSVSSQDAIATWAIPYSNQDGSPVGAVSQNLLPGPDGRLYAIGYPGAADQWHIFATTLPDLTQMRAAQVGISAARADTSRRITTTLRCTGQPGLFCSGTIAVFHAGHNIADQTYALAPGLRSSQTISLGQPLGHSKLEIVVKSVDANTAETVTTTSTLRR
jgi:hypothetical protein